MPIPGPLGGGGATTGWETTGGGAGPVIGSRQPGGGAWVASVAAPAAAALAPAAQTAARDWAVPKTASETNGSTVGTLLAGAAYTAWLESNAAAPAASAKLRIAKVIGTSRLPTMAADATTMERNAESTQKLPKILFAPDQGVPLD